MLKPLVVRLSDRVLADLKFRQHQINAQPSYDQQVRAALEQWPPQTEIFSELRDTLKRMCQGHQRCGYCEDSIGNQIEHIYPKSFYPSRVFLWENFLFICSPCNLAKTNKLAVFRSKDRVLVDLKVERNSRKTEQQPYPEPTEGDMVFIDPRSEDPMDLLFLDLNTGFYLAFGKIDSEDAVRAKKTIQDLDLNGEKGREYLVAARKIAYRHFLNALQHYCSAKRAGDHLELKHQKATICGTAHRTVWCEMIRQQAHFPILNELFAQAPEAFDF